MPQMNDGGSHTQLDDKTLAGWAAPKIRLTMEFLHKHAKEPYKSKRAISCAVYDPGMPFEVVGSGLVQVYEDHVFLTFGGLPDCIILTRANFEKHFDPAKKSHKLTNITEGEEDGKDETANAVGGDREQQDGDRNNLEDQVPKRDSPGND